MSQGKHSGTISSVIKTDRLVVHALVIGPTTGRLNIARIQNTLVPFLDMLYFLKNSLERGLCTFFSFFYYFFITNSVIITVLPLASI